MKARLWGGPMDGHEQEVSEPPPLVVMVQRPFVWGANNGSTQPLVYRRRWMDDQGQPVYALQGLRL